MTEFFTAISNFGFPVVVAGYLLFRFENKIDAMTEAVNNNTKATVDLIATVKRMHKRFEGKK